MMRRPALVALLATAALAGCGKRETLAPAPGHTLPMKPATAATQPTVEQLLTPDSQTRPNRSDELLRNSERRRQDRFDLPPPGRGGATAPGAADLPTGPDMPRPGAAR